MRRLLPPLACLCALALLVLAPGHSSSATAGAAQAKSKRANVVVIMTDDQTLQDLDVMTQTRRLIGGRGVTFDNSFVSYPTCCPSRATFLSGQYAHNHGVMGLTPPTGGYGRFDKANSLSVWMKRAGYYTSHIGKFLNGYGSEAPADVPPGWDEWRGSIDPSTYRMWGYTLNENGVFNTYGSEDVEDPAFYQTDVYRDIALDFIRRRANKRSPFFLSLAPLAPHHEIRSDRRRLPARPAPRHVGTMAGAPLPLPPSFDEADLSDKPGYVEGRSPPLTQEDVEEITANYRTRQESLLAVDEAVAALVGQLRRSGVYENTYIVFTSDNGFLQGEHRVRSGKMLPYDPSVRVPLLISGPGIARGRTSQELVGNIDLAPTLLDIADGRSGKTMDGRSLLPFAFDPKLRTERVLLLETGGQRPGRLEPDQGPVAPLRNILTYKAVRTEDYLYVAYRNGNRELYDMRRDPHQLESRHGANRYRDTRGALGRELGRLADCRGRECRADAGPIPGRGPRVDGDLGESQQDPAPAPARQRR
ncbi:MAG: sulfatase [Actinomycetota bacterium]|nr:sulfatase [Actinomycetota bacterium]